MLNLSIMSETWSAAFLSRLLAASRLLFTWRADFLIVDGMVLEKEKNGVIEIGQMCGSGRGYRGGSESSQSVAVIYICIEEGSSSQGQICSSKGVEVEVEGVEVACGK
jgi:hypothetical protein